MRTAAAILEAAGHAVMYAAVTLLVLAAHGIIQ